MQDPRYPIGKCVVDENITQDKRAAMIEELDRFSGELRALVAGLTDAQLDTWYREEGWTVRQLIHHLADSTLNWYIRIKMALTEQHPQIKPFDQDAWSDLPDARTSSPDLSIDILNAINRRMAMILRSMRPEDFQRTMFHPERGDISLDYTLQILHWHMRHHMAHIASLRARKGW